MKKNKPNYYDDAYEERWNDCRATGECLMAMARDVIVKQGVISLYPDGTDKKLASAEYEDAQQKMLTVLGNYDWCLTDLRDYYDTHHDQLERSVAWRPSRLRTGHQLIEKAYIDFHKGN